MTRLVYVTNVISNNHLYYNYLCISQLCHISLNVCCYCVCAGDDVSLLSKDPDKSIAGVSDTVSLVSDEPNTGKKQTYFPFDNTSHPDDSDADVLHYPVHEKVKPKKKVNRDIFFILTSNEVVNTKREAAEKKKQAESMKAERKMNKQTKQKKCNIIQEKENKEELKKPLMKRKTKNLKQKKDVKKICRNETQLHSETSEENVTLPLPATSFAETLASNSKLGVDASVHATTCSKGNSSSYYCFLCADSAEEAMIQCLQCKMWVHTGYSMCWRGQERKILCL